MSSPDEPLPSNNTMAPIEPVAHFRRASRRADKHVAKLERKIARFRAAGDHHRANQLERLLMRSHDLRLLSANRAAAKLTKKLRKHRGDRGSVTGPTKADVLRMARDLSLWRSSNEVVRLTTIPKAEGWRRIHSFGFEHRTRQEMLRRVIKAKGQTLPEQREATAAGVPALIENICEAIRGGYKYALICDFRDFYPSIAPAALSGHLKLPEKVVGTSIALDSFNLERRNAQQRRYDRPDRRSLSTPILHQTTSTVFHRRGIAEGSSASPSIAEVVMKGFLEVLPPNVRFFVWVDDILVLTKAIAEAELSKTLMSAAARRHPAGPFEFKRLLVRRVQDGFDFLGTHFRKRRGHAMARPADKNLREFRAEVFARRLTLLLTGAGLDKDEVYVRAWCRKLWVLATR